VLAQLSDLHSHATYKQLHYLTLSLQYTHDSEQRTRIASRIQALGGEVDSGAIDFGISPRGEVSRVAGQFDVCTDARLVALDFAESGQNIQAGGDHDWYAFDLAEGMTVRIETLSDSPGSFTDDTDLRLWGNCDVGGSGLDPIAFNDDKAGDFTSLITSNCLPAATYYVEVGGFADVVGVDNFTLEIDALEPCCAVTSFFEIECEDGLDGDCDGLPDDEDPDCLALLVSLESFTAEVTPAGVRLRWKTTSELDNVGFRILRGPGGIAKSEVVDLQLITPHLIPAQGTSLMGAQYEHFDALVPKAGVAQYYLEDIDTEGRTTRHGPVIVDFRDILRPGKQTKGR
jgi:hypothetical protein